MNLKPEKPKMDLQTKEKIVDTLLEAPNHKAPKEWCAIFDLDNTLEADSNYAVVRIAPQEARRLVNMMEAVEALRGRDRAIEGVICTPCAVDIKLFFFPSSLDEKLYGDGLTNVFMPKADLDAALPPALRSIINDEELPSGLSEEEECEVEDCLNIPWDQDEVQTTNFGYEIIMRFLENVKIEPVFLHMAKRNLVPIFNLELSPKLK